MANQDKQVVVTDVLTVRQALDAMYRFLEEYYRQTSSDDVGSLLGDLPGVGAMGTSSGDPGAWSDWLVAVERAVAQDTPGWREAIELLISDPSNLAGRDGWGAEWYGHILPNGRQLWASVFQGKLHAAGCNATPRAFDRVSGLVNAGYDVSA